MTLKGHRTGAVVALLAGLVLGSLAAAPSPAGAAEPSLAQLKKGGYVIYFRHGATDWQTVDRERVDLANCLTQRVLSDKGRAQARAIGEGFKKQGIPVGKVVSSPYCRTLETARLAFGRTDADPTLAQLDGKPSGEDWKPVFEALKTRLAVKPEPGTNTVLVGHGTNMLGASQVKLEEGQAAVFEPQGDGRYRLVGQINADGWGSLAP